MLNIDIFTAPRRATTNSNQGTVAASATRVREYIKKADLNQVFGNALHVMMLRMTLVRYSMGEYHRSDTSGLNTLGPKISIKT